MVFPSYSYSRQKKNNFLKIKFDFSSVFIWSAQNRAIQIKCKSRFMFCWFKKKEEKSEKRKSIPCCFFRFKCVSIVSMISLFQRNTLVNISETCKKGRNLISYLGDSMVCVHMGTKRCFGWGTSVGCVARQTESRNCHSCSYGYIETSTHISGLWAGTFGSFSIKIETSGNL